MEVIGRSSKGPRCQREGEEHHLRAPDVRERERRPEIEKVGGAEEEEEEEEEFIQNRTRAGRDS